MTTPLIVGLKKKNPETKISLFANKKFSEVCRNNPYIDTIYELDLEQFSGNGKEISFLQMYNYLNGMVELLKSKKFDILINLTHSRLSAIFSSLLQIPDVRGIVSNEQGDRIVQDRWLLYFGNLIYNRRYNMFHLIDIYSRSGNVLESEKKPTLNVLPEEDQWALDFLDAHNVSEGELLIGFQPGASREDRRWPTDFFVALGEQLINEKSAKIVIFGVNSEKGLADDIAGKLKPEKVINAVGKTTILQVAALLKKCAVLVTNDTGTMHIATAVETKVVALFYTHALIHETGPYGAGHIAIQADIPCSPCSHHTKCNNRVCREYITPGDVFYAITLLLKKHTLAPSLETHGLFARSRLYSTFFNGYGMIEYNPLIKKMLRSCDLLAYCYRAVWLILFNANQGSQVSKFDWEFIKTSGESVFRSLKDFFDLSSYQDIKTSLQVSLDAFLSLHGKFKGGEITSFEIQSELRQTLPDMIVVKELGTLITEVDVHIEAIVGQHPEVGPIYKMFLFGKENLQGDDAVTLAEDTANLYKIARTECEVMTVILKVVLGNLSQEHSNVKVLPEDQR